jgi:16S rRNA (cytidine1402-2'-O)-methyltransferase
MSTLYIVATPIGNLSDTSGRAIEVLGSVDGVLAEDTRRTKILMDHFELRVPLTSLHEHNEASRIAGIVDRLNSGQRLALVSDAGTPLVSDPGERLVRTVVEAGHDVVPVPGPSAILTALVAAGFPTVPFTFYGFVPRKKGPRVDLLERIVGAGETSVVFESPERLGALLNDLGELAGEERPVVVAREMTKIHEEFFRGTMGDAARYYAERRPRGEITVVVSPNVEEENQQRIDEAAARALAQALLAEGLTPSRAAREVSSRLKIAKNMAYEIVHSIPGDDDPASEEESSLSGEESS